MASWGSGAWLPGGLLHLLGRVASGGLVYLLLHTLLAMGSLPPFSPLGSLPPMGFLPPFDQVPP